LVLLLNTIRAVAWFLILLCAVTAFTLTDNAFVLVAVFMASYAAVMTGADVIQQRLIELFDSES
jgi:hypothetical protein